jgi:hypothetical protein
MAGNIVPIFGLTPHFSQAQTATANTNRDGVTGAYTTVFTATTNGSRIDVINIKYQASTTAGMVRLWVYDLTSLFLRWEIPVDAITVSANTPSFEYELRRSDGGALIWFASGCILKFTTHNAESCVVSADGWDW